MLIVGGALAAAAFGTGATASQTTSCHPSGKTLAHDSAAAVYATGGGVYGCADSAGIAYKLGSTGTCVQSARIDHVALAGTVAAFGLERCGVDTGTTMIEVRRLTDNHAVLPVEPAITGPLGAESYESVGSLVVRRDGAVAWIARGDSIVGHGPTEVELHRVDSHEHQTLLDSGAGIASGSLRLRGSRLTWRHGQAKRHATLR